METVSFKELENWWDGKVIVRQLTQFSDERGMVCETYRSDSDAFKHSKMCYISTTKPFVQRGPHSHAAQCDEFVTWDSQMIYQLYNPVTDEMRTFVTPPTGIYNVKVDVGILHSYRALNYKKDALTMNYPSALFKGEGKSSEPDEIRHENDLGNNHVYFVFGAGGKLGKSLVDTFYKHMGNHKYDVVPCYDKLLNSDELDEFVKNLTEALKGRKVTFFNCAALTNTGTASSMNNEWNWVNASLPYLFGKLCADNKWKFIQFSTDYIYQAVKPGVNGFQLSDYTKSKQIMEEVLLSDPELKTTIVLRVANLFSLDVDDKNIFTRFLKLIKETGELTVDPEIEVFPTDVSTLSEYLVTTFVNTELEEGMTFLNVLTPSYKLDNFVNKFFGVTPKVKSGFIIPWGELFKNVNLSDGVIQLDTNEDKIKEFIKKL